MSEQEGKEQANGVVPAASAPQVRVAATGHDELHTIKAHIDAHGKTLLIAIAVVVVAALGFSVFKGKREAARAEASALLFTARSVQDLDNMVLRYGSTPVAPLGLLKLGKAHFDAGSFEMAGAKYDEFKQKYPKHPFVLAAVLGKLHCQEAQGMTEQALAGYSSFIADHPKHFLAAEAIFGKGRCLEALGRTKEAKIVYEDLLAQDREGPWATRAEEQIALLKRKLGENTQEEPKEYPITNQPVREDASADAPPAAP